MKDPTISMITTVVAILAIMCVGTVCYMSTQQVNIPPELNTLTGGLVGAVTAMLIRPKSTAAEPAGTVTVPEQKLDTEKQ